MSEDVSQCDHFPDVSIDGRVILKLFLNKWCEWGWTTFHHYEGLVFGFCECGNEDWGFSTWKEILTRYCIPCGHLYESVASLFLA